MRRLWMIFIAIFVFSFAILGWVGSEIFRQSPPIPREVVTTDGQTIVAEGEVSDGQNVWQAMGGMEVGSIWGHGSYVAPDWTADYLHREALFILDGWAKAEFAQSYSALGSEQQSMLRQRLQDTLRKNTYDAQTGRITVEPIRAQAFEYNLKHYTGIFTNGNESFAIQRNAQSDPAKLRELTAFFFWTSWAAVTNRPNQTLTYTSNFPSEPLAGTPTVALAFGATFSALEIVPLTMVGFEAWDNIRRARLRPWLQQYKWVIHFFVAVAFWNLIGAGIFGFMVNPPIALYYMQGLNTTAVHAHGALYGVYGTLGLGLMLFCLRAMKPELRWQERWIRLAFWAINIGMLMEMLLSLLPIGLLQTYQSVSVGYWSARSPEFMQTDVMQVLRWMRMAGDTVFAIGAVAFGYFILKLIFRRPKAAKIINAVPEMA